MKVTVNWLRKYVEFDWDVDELAERLTMLGVEVEAIQRVGSKMEGVVVAQIRSREPHPKADRLSVCRVFDGKEERQIVCGATNFKPGDKAALILPGHALPGSDPSNPFVIQVARIRGVESHGMLCSEKELGLSDEAEGIMILPDDAPVGMPLAQYLGCDEVDYVLDLEITPNRPDLNSVIGVAREIAAAAGTQVRLPEVTITECDEPNAARLVEVAIEDPELCPRYTARVVLGVQVGPSPAWLKWTLKKVGIRSINNVVDVTNYVLMESGQPLHAFDYHLLARGLNGIPRIIVRRAAPGEKITTLDGVERQLHEQDLLIADPEKPIALAGVMGGADTEIRETTTDVLIESACFHPVSIRRTARRHNLHTEASYRFERGVDLPTVDWASKRCAQLIQQLAGGVVARGVVDQFLKPRPVSRIRLRYRRVSELLGVEIRPEEVDYYLGQLGIRKIDRKPEPVGSAAQPEAATFEVPSFRLDLHREADLIEEVCRLHGVDKIPAATPRGGLGRHPFDSVYDRIQLARQLLTGLGLTECQGQTLVSAQAALLTASSEELIKLERPLSMDMNVLRPSLLPGLLDIVRHNHNHQNYDLALFEIGRVFRHVNGKPVESRELAIALMGRRHLPFWQAEEAKARFDIFDLKGIIEAFCEHYRLPRLRFVRRSEPTPLFAESAEIRLGQEEVSVGQLGQVAPDVLRQYDLRYPVFLAELDFDQLISRRNETIRFRPLPIFPAVRRDIALLVPEQMTHEQIEQAIHEADLPYLESVELFDVYRGANIPSGMKSLAYTIQYRSHERTLRDEEVNEVHQKLIQWLERRLGVKVRIG